VRCVYRAVSEESRPRQGTRYIDELVVSQCIQMPKPIDENLNVDTRSLIKRASSLLPFYVYFAPWQDEKWESYSQKPSVRSTVMQEGFQLRYILSDEKDEGGRPMSSYSNRPTSALFIRTQDPGTLLLLMPRDI
jgi:hypothetical protein